jgi:hypothetical protein
MEEEKRMTAEDAKRYLHPKCSEVFDTYLCIGFRADDQGLLVVGDPGKYWNLRRDKLRACLKNLNELFADEQIESFHK